METFEDTAEQLPQQPAQLQDPTTTLIDPTPGMTTTSTATTMSTMTTPPPLSNQPQEALRFPDVDVDAMTMQKNNNNIDEVIRRDAVEPGSGKKKYLQIGQAHWTDNDQQELERLLEEGRDVYVPPDVDTMDLPVPRARDYSYVVSSTSTSSLQNRNSSSPPPPLNPQQLALQSSSEHQSIRSSTSVSDRIAQWNQVVSTTNEKFNFNNKNVVMGGSTSSDNHMGGQKIHHTSVGGVGQENNKIFVTDFPSSSSEHLPSQLQQPTNVSTDRQYSSSPSFQPNDSSIFDEDTEKQLLNLSKLTTSVDIKDDPKHDADVVYLETTFGFLTTPVTSKKSPSIPDMKEFMKNQSDVFEPQPREQQLQLQLVQQQQHEHEEGEEESRETISKPLHQVILKSDSTSARVNVTEDYGLKGGHDSIVNDATFVHNDTKLVTCGDDGKVCIWDMENRNVQYEFVPYDKHESVIMVYPLQEEEDVQYDHDSFNNQNMYTLITLSQSRILRIWLVDSHQAIMLRNSNISQSETDLYMTVTPISKLLKAKAIAAAAAAAVTTSHKQPIDQTITSGTADPLVHEEEEEEDDDDSEVIDEVDVEVDDEVDDFQGIAENVNEEQIIEQEVVVVEDDEEEEEEEEEEKVIDDDVDRGRSRFSLSNVLNFNKSGSRNAVIAD